MKQLPKKIVYLDLFSGTGGFALGLKQAGFAFKKHYFSEIDKYAAANYQYNFKDGRNLGDITKVSGKEIERPDIITFGSPCQDVSIAGKREGIKGKRSGLFFEAVRLIRACRPRVFIFENVKGLFSSNGSKDFEAVLRAFADIGLYDCQWQLLNTAWFLPQNRERIYFVGHLRGTARPKVFPIGEGDNRHPENDKEENKREGISPTIDTKAGETTHRSPYVLQRKKPRLVSLRNIKDSAAIFKVSEATNLGYSIAQVGDSIDLSYLESNNRRGRVGRGVAHTLATSMNQYTLDGNGVRRLTPVECERLQGFPDQWTAQGVFDGEIQPISDSQRYKMLGNAVSVAVVEEVATRLLRNKNELGTIMEYKQRPEIVLGSTAEVDIPELNVSYSRNGKPFLGSIYRTHDVATFIRSTFGAGELELQEFFTVLYLNPSMNIIGYYRHTKGKIDATLMDTRIILATALKCLATGIIIAHNHPSQNNNPSDTDKKLTAKMKDACRNMSISLIDHVIVTTSGFYSFAENGMAGLEPIVDNRRAFVDQVKIDLASRKKHTKLTLEKLAAGSGINDKTEVKELIELALVETARNIAGEELLTINGKYDRIVALYNNQVNLSHRTSQSILLQQYSTPAPIGFLMGIFCGVDKPGIYLEPSAGNGMLTVAGKPEHFCVNEIDDLRYHNLKTQGFYDVISTDAVSGYLCSEFDVSRFDAVLTNPPFGMMDAKVKFDDFPIQPLEHVMALRALECMKDSGRAAIIIGGHTGWDRKGRMQAGKNRLFFNYLYSHYHVIDVIPVNGKKLYSRQGTGFNTRVILIDGRKKKSEGNAPVFNQERDTMVSTFDNLFARVMSAMEIKTNNQPFTSGQIALENMEREAKKLFQALRGITSHPKNIISGTSEMPHDKIVDYDVLYEQFKEEKSQGNEYLYLFETPETYCAFNEDAEHVAKTFNIRLIKRLGNGGFRYLITAISKSHLAQRTDLLRRAGFRPFLVEMQWYHFKDIPDKEDKKLNRILNTIDRKGKGGLGAPYEPVSNACIVLDTQVPDSMAYETHSALSMIKDAVGGDVDNFVRDRLGYPTKTALCKALSAEQTDAVMMAIYNIEARGQGMIIGDQTGIGKGRVAAAMIRYGCHQGMKPVFLTEKANLFSDIYRDLYAIGSGRLKPFIVNGREGKTDIKDEDGNIIFQALPFHEQQVIFSSRIVPASFDFVVATYTQFNSPEKKPEKPAFLSAIAEGNIAIMDEAHNSSGSSNTGNFLQGVIAQTKGVVFLSATFAKRPDNMPIYAMKTAISDCNMSRDQLIESIQRGGVALQEVLSSQLVAEGQMLRRERSFEGVEVNYITLSEKAEEHRAIADNITGIVRDIIAFQKDFIDVVVEQLDDIAVAEGKQVDIREGTSQAGVDSTPYFSKVFNIINQMLFSIKATSIAERAIDRLREGKKPIIAFASTMGSFLEDMEDENGLPVSDGSTVNPDFSEVLRRGLEGVMRYTERDITGKPEYKKFEVSDLSAEGQAEYHKISKKIEEISTGITLSPIDVVIKKIRDAGYSVAEVTGRKFELQMNQNGSKALVMTRKRINTNDAFRQFNNNEVDVLMINQSGSTGASAHAVPTAKVPRSEVRQRVMIVLQAELDINTEVQKRGRVNRTGQIMKPVYDYPSSAIPAENRLMMMLQRKLKSLDANTASNQKQSAKILDVPDFLNKYGDKVVKEYLLENPKVNGLLDDPLRLKNTTDSDQGDADAMENAAHKVSGRVAVLSVKMQEDFYNEITERYSDYVAYLQQIGEYDLELEAMNLEAETLNSKVVKMGSGSGSSFSEDSILETVKANVLKKPFTATELDNLLKESLQGEDAKKMQREIISDYDEETGMALEIDEKELKERYDELERRIYTEKKFQRLQTDEERQQYIRDREEQIGEAKVIALEELQKKAANRKHYLERIFRFFYVGRNLNFPVDSFDGYKEYVPTVFLGFVIDWKRKNPFLPSKIKLRFALANSSKYFAIPASYDDIDLIIGASTELPEQSIEQILLHWANYIQQNNVDRKTRHIITGNLLQAFSDYKGKLVNYTTIDGKINKGILMPEHWAADEQVQDKVSIPVFKALPLIKSLVAGKHITTNTGIGFLRQADQYKIIVPMSRKAGGDIYLDKQLLALVDGNNFQRTSDKMTATLPLSDIGDFVEVIQTNHNCAVTVTRHQFNSLEKQAGMLRRRKPIRLPEPEQEYRPANNVKVLELEAEALVLKLRLMAA